MRWQNESTLSAELLATALGQPTPTPEQREVIEADPVPALVVAGAGSGKTETMAGRVVWLVANGHVDAAEILGLTFTRKAAGELAERIAARLARIGEYAERGLLPHLAALVAEGALAEVADPRTPELVRLRLLDRLAERCATGWNPQQGASVAGLVDAPTIATYNAFADQLVREHAAHIGRDPDAALLPGGASWLIARDAVVHADAAGLDELDSAFTTIVDAVRSLAASVTDHRADPPRVADFARETAEALEPFVDPAKDREIEKVWRRVGALPRLLDVVAEYEQEKLRRGVLDFADQVTGALAIVEVAPQVADALRDQYRVVLLDEYQDTSVIQTRLLARLFRDGAVMAVGDPNQSIYGWRGASADNLHAFARDFADTTTAAWHDLMVSWRNDRAILTAANTLLARAEGGLDVATLRERPGAAGGRVERVFTDTVEQEAAAVADWFAATHGPDVHQGATGAILFRTKRHMAAFADALSARAIPHRVLGLGGLMQAPEVIDVVSALRVLHDPSAGSALIRLLVGPRFAIGIADMGALYDLARILAQSSGSLSRLPDELIARIRASSGADEQSSIVDALDVVRALPDGHSLLRLFSAQGRVRLGEAGAMFERMRRASTLPIPELLRLIEAELRLDIELAANETRGSARSARAQLHRFADEVRSFVQADDRGTIGSLLAYLDYAERADDLMPRTEPPEPGVVQLLTVHGSKGLEWDRVAIARLVDGEFPGGPRGTAGWLGFGELPYPFRGDAAALPVFAPAITEQTTVKDVEATIADFKKDVRRLQLGEERRLAYVAVTRARGELLLSGSSWSGGTTPRAASPFLAEIGEAMGWDQVEPLDRKTAENPCTGEGETRQWPLDALGARRQRVQRAADEVRAAAHVEPSAELGRLLAERRERDHPTRREAPVRVPASRFKDYVTDFAGTAAGTLRPMPERPFTQTRIGTLFHEWVERRSGGFGQGDLLDDPQDTEELERDDAAALDALQRSFAGSEWADLEPIEVETEIDFTLPGTDRIIICKLDAVYRRGDRIEIVDWKTGRPPRGEEETELRLLQLALYRVAYHERHGVPLENIDVALFYVADDLVLRPDAVLSGEDLAARWQTAAR
ncbi:MAG: ATP-dependent DNA helicase [Microbacterium sp.]